MSTFEDIEEFRRSKQSLDFADQWIAEERAGNPAGDKHMDLLVWQKYHPHQALGIILSLLEKAESDDQTCEMIALGPVQQIVELAEDSFVPLLREAVYRHPLFELCTRFKRQHTDSDRWFQIN